MRRTRNGLLLPVGEEIAGWRTENADAPWADRFDAPGPDLLVQMAKRMAPVILPRIKGGTDTPFFSAPNPAMVASQTAVTGTAETALWPVSPWTSVGANGISPNAQPGQLWLVAAFGTISTAASSEGNLTLTPRWGTSSGGTSFGASAAIALAASASNVPWVFLGFGDIRAISSSASSSTIAFGGVMFLAAAALTTPQPIVCGGTVPTTCDTTTAQGWYLGVTLGSASDSMTTQYATAVCGT